MYLFIFIFQYDALNIPPSRLDIVVPEELPLSAEVSILPASSFEVEGEEDVTVVCAREPVEGGGCFFNIRQFLLS